MRHDDRGGREERDAYLRLLVEEYRTLANSGNQSDRHTYTALQWGTAVVAVIVSAAASQWGDHNGVVEGALLILVPSLIAFGMLFWVGELARMRRIYDFICVAEAKAELVLRSGWENGGAWYTVFAAEWTDASAGTFRELGLVMPAGEDGAVWAHAAPIEFERWLRRIRIAKASSNLSWVFMFRFALFPLGIAGAWGTGVYYLLSHPGPQGSKLLGIAVALAGGLSSGMAAWLAVELASDLNDASSDREISPIRQQLRSRTHKLLALPEWSQRS